jgi:hypothetical protein
MLQIVVTLTGNSRGIIYDRNIFMIQSTGRNAKAQQIVTSSYLNICQMTQQLLWCLFCFFAKKSTLEQNIDCHLHFSCFITLTLKHKNKKMNETKHKKNTLFLSLFQSIFVYS